MITRRQSLGLLILVPVAAGGAYILLRDDGIEVGPDGRAMAVNTEGGIAIKGIDPVAYFTEQRPIEGSPEHAVEWNGAEWHFASAENAARFEEAPETYAPAYGGYCAWAVAQNTLADFDPEAWAIHEDRLYLNLNPDVQERWSEDIPGNITKAGENWPEVLTRS